MGLLSSEDREALRKIFEKELDKDVKITLYTFSGRLSVPGVETGYVEESKELLKEVCELSPKLSLEVVEADGRLSELSRRGIRRFPTIVLSSEHNGKENIRIVGIPAGYEFRVFLDAIVMFSRGSDEDAVCESEANGLVRVFTTPVCPHCPGVASNMVRIVYPLKKVTLELVEASEFPEYANEFGITGVPTTIVDNLDTGTRHTKVGAMPMADCKRLLEEALCGEK